MKYIPGIGWWVWGMGWPLLGRNTYDRELLSTHDHPFPISIFPEGTRYTTEKHAQSHKYAIKNNIVVGRNTMLPRSGGAYCLAHNNKCQNIHIQTIVYNRNIEFPYVRAMPNTVHVFTRSYDCSTVPLNTEEEFCVWLQAKFVEMDHDFKSAGE
jgi:1-acyl-sn-glycerol-3-phosphate acyltransferase